MASTSSKSAAARDTATLLLSRLKPKSYLGIDLMPEMIDLALKRKDVPHADFRLMDAADMRQIADAGKDAVVIFDILHHIPRWREVLSECSRVLRPAGRFSSRNPAPPRYGCGIPSSTGATPRTRCSPGGSWKPV